MKLRQLEPSVAVRGLHHRDLRPDALEPHHAVHPTALDRPLALQFESKLDEERRRGREVVNHDADVLDPFESHVFDGKDPDSGRGARRRKRRAVSASAPSFPRFRTPNRARNSAVRDHL